MSKKPSIKSLKEHDVVRLKNGKEGTVIDMGRDVAGYISYITVENFVYDLEALEKDGEIIMLEGWIEDYTIDDVEEITYVCE